MRCRKVNKRLKHWLIGILIVVGVICIGIGSAGYYFYNMAVARGKKTFINNSNTIKKSDPLYHEKSWYRGTKKLVWHETSATKHFKLVANYVPASKQTNKTIVIAHGFGGSSDKMGEYAGLFHELGYNVLLPDDRGAGKSQGNYIGYGWPDRLDYLKWIKQVIRKNGPQSQIVVFGTSMGGATTMMVSGEKTPKQVKAYIEDCGYTSIYDEIKYQAKSMYNIPEYPLVPVVSGINYLKNGYTFKQASALKQVAKNHKPMLFIHGTSDTFVPTRMVYPLYKADKGPKRLLLVNGAKHAKSYEHAPALYRSTVKAFLDRYFN
ncbi:alpha/beta hydrolase [Secundilactobacillus silagincola]|uniref:alpha/beta hydrolase n=1 Tax=Secundilactobacillus silagincola TaxID=1714681 RepID=UPI000BFCBFEB